VDVGVSESTDLQARAILKAAAISGKLTPIHLLVAHALLRTPSINVTNAESAGAAIAAGAEAAAQALESDNLTAKQFSIFMAALSRGLGDAAALYRTSVDDAVSFDQKVEAYRRGEAFAVLLQALVAAGMEAGINLETISTAFAAAGGAAETVLEATPDIDPFTRAEMRLAYITGILNLSNYRMLREQITSLGYVGMAPPRFARMFSVIDLGWNNTTANQKKGDGELSTVSIQSGVQAIRVLEFTSLAMQDLMLSKMGMELYAVSAANVEYAALMLEITGRMAVLGGAMTGMTPELLMEILGRSTFPIPLLDAQQIVQAAVSAPTLNPYELGAWSYIHREPAFAYTPIPGLIDQLTTRPEITPAFDRLGEPYKSLALLMYDIQLVSSLRWQDQQAADEYSSSHPLNPPGWYPLTIVHQIVDSDRRRLELVRQHISGVPTEAKNALMCLVKRRVTEF
jgi:hypothetical protein